MFFKKTTKFQLHRNVTLLMIIPLTRYYLIKKKKTFIYIFFLGNKVIFIIFYDKTQLIRDKTFLRIIPSTYWFFGENKILFTHIFLENKNQLFSWNNSFFEEITLLKIISSPILWWLIHIMQGSTHNHIKNKFIHAKRKA